MKRKLLIALILAVALVGINIAFFNNLKNLPTANYYVLLLAINIDLFALIIITAVILRKLIKVYLGKRRNILRRKLANILFLYLFIPLLILNVISTVVVIQSTKTYLSSKTRSLSSYAEDVYKNVYKAELDKLNTYRNIVETLLTAGLMEEVNKFREVESIIRVPECNFDVSEGEFNYILCIKVGEDHYKVSIKKDIKLIRDLSQFGQLAIDVQTFIKTRDIITGVFVFFIVFITLVTLLATVWLGMLVARHISQPIESLSDKAMRIAMGNLDVDVEVQETGDEIEELSKAFKKMKDNLRQIYEDLKNERDLLEKLLDALPVGVLYIDRKGNRRANRTFTDLFGNASPEEVEEKVKEDRNLRLEKIQVGNGYILLVEDISSIVLAERFKTWQEAVKRIAHEIKNPLTPIRLNLERLGRYSQSDNIDREKFHDLIKIMLKEIDRISDLINQFKHLSSTKELDLSEISLSKFFEDIKKLYSSAGISIEVEGDKTLKADVSLLKEVFYNLINNSVEWGAKNVKITVNNGRLEYRDDGKGIPDHEVENIFMPYYSSNPKGMGLGMAVVKRVIEDHGWNIKALPSEKGAYFVIDFRSRN